MRLLDRYLLRELLIPLGYCLCGFLIFWIAFDLFSELNRFQERRLLLSDIAELYLVKIPDFLVLILPVALLLALLYTLTNHARHHELTAIRAAGVSLWRITVPYFLVGLLLSLGLLALNEFWVPNTVEREEQILDRRLEKSPASANRDVQSNLSFENTRAGRIWQIGSFNFQTRIMTDPNVDWKRPGGADLWIFAKRAERINDVWTFSDNVREYQSDPGNGAQWTLLLQTNLLAMPQFSETPDQIKRELRFNNRLAARSAQSTEIPINEIIGYLRLHPDLQSKSRWWLYTQLQGRLAAPWTCLVVVLIAIPFGAASGRRNIFVGVAGSIVICFAYFVLLKLGLALGTGGYVPAWIAAWLPNLSFALAGLGLMLRVR